MTTVVGTQSCTGGTPGWPVVDGNFLYAISQGSGTILKVDLSTGACNSSWATGVPTSFVNRVKRIGNSIYVLDTASATIARVDLASGGAATTVATISSGTPWDMVAAGNFLYVLDVAGPITRLNLSGSGSPVSFATAPSLVRGIAVAGGFLYVAGSSLYQFPLATGGSPVNSWTLGGGYYANLAVANGVAATVGMSAAPSADKVAIVKTLPSASLAPAGQTVSATVGTPVSTTPISAATFSVSPVTFTISPNLPAGLSFDPSTGIISGTPSAAFPLTTFTITGTDGVDTSTSTVSLAVNAAPSLAATGSAPAVPLATGGVSLLVGGAILTIRRRFRSSH